MNNIEYLKRIQELEKRVTALETPKKPIVRIFDVKRNEKYTALWINEKYTGISISYIGWWIFKKYNITSHELSEQIKHKYPDLNADTINYLIHRMMYV